MEKFYCSERKAELDKSDIRAKVGIVVEDDGHGSPTFYNKSKYYCTKHNSPVEVNETIEKK